MWEHPEKFHQMGILHFFYREFTTCVLLLFSFSFFFSLRAPWAPYIIWGCPPLSTALLATLLATPTFLPAFVLLYFSRLSRVIVSFRKLLSRVYESFFLAVFKASCSRFRKLLDRVFACFFIAFSYAFCLRFRSLLARVFTRFLPSPQNE